MLEKWQKMLEELKKQDRGRNKMLEKWQKMLEELKKQDRGKAILKEMTKTLLILKINKDLIERR